MNVTLYNGKEIIVAYLTDYFIGKTAVIEACKDDPIPNIILYSSWQQWVEEAKLAAEKMQIPVLSFSEFEEQLLSFRYRFKK